ncbi:hypothetical protein [Olleya sp. HaHaR_3_96]|uniref:hypothetical protein n=1 Tax=Olleya sp. HaHaR_3_96 TaxID=2745560 RepID=UPI001C4FF139|nr:hypothetical protein [Olleya sp. HaHaR_3_96]QXP59085.1 hypothetical protein H0I26_14320 [Olleya sp. HaHaR_3_96]
MKIIFKILFFIACINCSYAQKKVTHTITKSYIPLKEYQKRNKEPLSKQDSLNLIEKDGILLILMKENIAFNKKGTSVPYTYKDDSFLAKYTKISFFHKNNIYNDSTTSKYWKKPIKLFFGKNIPNKTKKSFLHFAKNIVNQVDSLQLYVVKKVEDSNYIIYYSSNYEYESRMSNNTYSDSYIHWKNTGSQIYKGAIRIRDDKLFNETLRLHKMKTLFVQTLGYFTFDNQLDCENFFSGCHQDPVNLTKFDIEIIKYHYDYGICKGTDLSTFIEQHKDAKKLLQKNPNNKMTFFHTFE